MIVTTVVRVDLANPVHQSGIVDLVNMYASEPLQGGEPLDDKSQKRLLPGLADQVNGRYFLALQGERPVGLAICFIGFSTFRALPLLNVHDLAVHHNCRGQGIGTMLLEAAEREAVRLGCCKLTLEVLQENKDARRLYERMGYDSGGPASAETSYMAKSL